MIMEALGMVDRIVRCKIEMDLVEGEHFNPSNKNISDEEAINLAMKSFETQFESDFEDYIQAKIVEPIGDN